MPKEQTYKDKTLKTLRKKMAKKISKTKAKQRKKKEQQLYHDSKGKFCKGNPGRPIGAFSLTKALRHLMAVDAYKVPSVQKIANRYGISVAKKTVNEVLVEVQITQMMEGNSAYMKEIWDRVEGKLVQKIEQHLDGQLGISDAIRAVKLDGENE